MRMPPASEGSGAMCSAPLPGVSVVCVVIVRATVEALNSGVWGECVIDRVCAVVCVCVEGFPCFMCVSWRCVGMQPRSPELGGPDATRRSPLPGFARSCHGAWCPGKRVGATSGGSTPLASLVLVKPGDPSRPPGGVQQTQACGNAGRPEGAI